MVTTDLVPLSQARAGGLLRKSVTVGSKLSRNTGELLLIGELLGSTEVGGVTVDGGCLGRTNTIVSGNQAKSEQMTNLGCVRLDIAEKKPLLVDFEDPLIMTDMTLHCKLFQSLRIRFVTLVD